MMEKNTIQFLTGKKTRLVWTQQQEGCEDFASLTADHRIMVRDSNDDGRERDLLGTIGSYVSPMITPDGQQVVYTENTKGEVRVVNWDGSDNRTVCPGFLLTVWEDPETKIVWVYSRSHRWKLWNSKSRPVVRRRLDDPSTEELVWDRKNVTWHWLSLSKDGTQAALCAPWPQCGMASMPNGELRVFDKGCWTEMAPDNSHRMWVFDGNHREVKLYSKQGEKSGVLDIHGAPGIQGWEIYHPRWSNNLQYITVNGPYTRNHDGPCTPEKAGNLIPQGGYNVDLYLGKVSADLSKVEQWVRITDNNKADFGGYAWIEPE